MSSTPKSVCIKNGTLALPDGRLVEGDLGIRSGKIAELGTVTGVFEEEIDAQHLLVMPGVIDPQVHFREPGAEHKEDLSSGSRACVAGGVTSFLEMPNTKPPTTTREAIADKKYRASQKSLANYGFFIGATPDNLTELNEVSQVPGIKIFMGSSTGDLLVNEPSDLERIFSQGSRLIAVHAEDEARMLERMERYQHIQEPYIHSQSRDPLSALLATQRAVQLSQKYQRRLHILHLSTAEEVDYLREEKAGHPQITAEVTPQHLWLNEPEIYERLGTYAQMNPPLRSKRHSYALWKGLHDGVLNCIATDHAPHTRSEKEQEYGLAPSGMPGVETSLSMMLQATVDERCTTSDVVRWMTAAPAQIYGIKNKGQLKLGYDADLVLVDLNAHLKVGDRPYFSKCGWSPFEGMQLRAWPIITFVHGMLVFAEGKIIEHKVSQPLIFETT